MADSGRQRRRDWTELPDELTAAILSRLGTVDILENAQKVCMKWRRISKDPVFWRKIDMLMVDDDWDKYEAYDSIFRHAVYRSSGNVVDINIEHFATDEQLEFITENCASTIRHIRLYSCEDVSDEELVRMAQKMPLLEELDITLCAGTSHKAVEAFGRHCPLLKSLKFNKEWCRFSDDESDFDEYEPEPDFYEPDFNDMDDDDYYYGAPPFGHAPFWHAPLGHAPLAHARVRKDVNGDAVAIAETMQGLRHLQLYGNKLTDDGLIKILDCCPHLESLDLRLCLNLNMGIDLETRCAERIKRLWLPHDSREGKEFTCRSDGYCYKWTQLPDDITMSIISRLGTIDILENAQKVCMKWRKVCKELKWNTLDIRNDSAPDIPFNLEKMCRHVVDLSCGNLVDVNVEDFITNEILDYITRSSSGIRRLRLVNSYYISVEGLIEVASKLPLLEDLDLSYCGNLSHKPVKVLGSSCPLLKSFTLNKEWHKFPDNVFEGISDDEGPWGKDDDALAIAGTMHGLHHLQLIGNQLTDDGLRAILDSCPHLESLDLRSCFNLNLEGDLGRRCIEQIKKVLLPEESMAVRKPPSLILPKFWDWGYDDYHYSAFSWLC